ncbi:MAG TPA: hypothetical protein VND19_24325 [Acetobacteraceae bacterium]|nr:hypothetical protein [Acetobacteraceae bacterium]
MAASLAAGNPRRFGRRMGGASWRMAGVEIEEVSARAMITLGLQGFAMLALMRRTALTRGVARHEMVSPSDWRFWDHAHAPAAQPAVTGVIE